MQPGADGTDAEQSNHNLLLSERSEIDAKPELEIYADEVKCSHGTTVGQLDDAALFYLRSRGLDRQAAMRALTRAFGASIVSHAPIALLTDHHVHAGAVTREHAGGVKRDRCAVTQEATDAARAVLELLRRGAESRRCRLRADNPRRWAWARHCRRLALA